MHQEINSPDISKVYACVFRPVKSPMRTLYKHISLKLSFFKENVRYPVWACRDPISLILGTRFSLILGTRC